MCPRALALLGPCPPNALSPVRVQRGREWPLLLCPQSGHRTRTAPQHSAPLEPLRGHACCPWSKKGLQQLGQWGRGCAGWGGAVRKARSLGARGRWSTPGCRPVCRRQGGSSPRTPGRHDQLRGGSSWSSPGLLRTCLVGRGVGSRKGAPRTAMVRGHLVGGSSWAGRSSARAHWPQRGQHGRWLSPQARLTPGGTD